MLLCNNTHPLLHIKYAAVDEWCMIVITLQHREVSALLNYNKVDRLHIDQINVTLMEVINLSRLVS